MQWIKRNLFLVIGGVVALGLLGFAGFYLYTKIQQDNAVTEELAAATQKLEGLAKREPYPNPENIKAAKDEAKRVQGFLEDVEKHFASAPYPQQLNNMEFRTYLETTRSELLADALRSGVEVPTNYWFSFAAQKGAMTFSEKSLQPLASQLADIRTICEVLFDAKINSLVWLRRVPVDSQDQLGSQDYMNAKPITNNWGTVMPYEVTFQGFSAQLASVLEGLVRLPYCFVVTNLVVEPAASAGQSLNNPNVPFLSVPQGESAAQNLMNRYSRYARYGGMMGPPPAPVAPVATGPTNFLDEKPLRFTLYVQAVKLKPQTPTAAPKK
jgi:hypothetical protein